MSMRTFVLVFLGTINNYVKKLLNKSLLPVNNRMLALIFCTVMSVFILLFLIGIVNNPAGDQMNVFFIKTNNLFADFLNNLRYIADKDPYFNTVNGYQEKIYLPLVYMMLYPFSSLDSYSTMVPGITSISVLIYTFISLSILFISLSSLCKDSKYKLWILAVLFFSSITLFSIERGNTILITSGFVISFLALYKSPNKSYRFFALVFLSLAATFKVYPVLLGLLLLKNRDYQGIIISGVLTLLLVFLPFFFFEHGYENIDKLISNVGLNSSSYGPERLYQRFGLPHLTYYASSHVLGISENVTQFLITASSIATVVLSIISIILSFLVKDQWKEVALIIFVIIMFPTNSGLYSGLYFFPVIILFLIKEEKTKLDLLYLFLFFLFLNPFQVVIEGSGVSSINSYLSNISILSLWLITIVTSSVEYYFLHKSKLQKK